VAVQPLCRSARRDRVREQYGGERAISCLAMFSCRSLPVAGCGEYGGKFGEERRNRRSPRCVRRTVNPSADAYAGSNPAPATSVKNASGLHVVRGEAPGEMSHQHRLERTRTAVCRWSCGIRAEVCPVPRRLGLDWLGISLASPGSGGPVEQRRWRGEDALSSSGFPRRVKAEPLVPTGHHVSGR
jgi:hypothetical protein